MLRIVAATVHDSTGFQTHALLARSLRRLHQRAGVQAHVAVHNACGLPAVFNTGLAAADADDLIVFTHDDVALDDWFLPERLGEALARFDVVGVAGNRRRVPRQPAWIFPSTTLVRDTPDNLSGTVVHLLGDKETMTYYGESPAAVKLLDGLFLASRVGRLRQAGIAFDRRFSFHFYDLDFCRSCERAGLTMGTWPIAVAHGSSGRFRTPEWRKAYENYLAKWGE